MLDLSELSDVYMNDEEPHSSVEEMLKQKEFELPKEFADVEVWANYINDDLYYLDKEIRRVLDELRYRREAHNGIKTTAGLMFSLIFGRKCEKSDGGVCRMINEILMYYCTCYKNHATFHGKKVNRLFYFSRFSARDKLPYSMRLRLETRQDQSKHVTFKRIDPRVDKEIKGRFPNTGRCFLAYKASHDDLRGDKSTSNSRKKQAD